MVAPGIVLFDDVDAEHWAKRIIRNSNREIITSQTGEAMRKVAFICVHNSCRSQIAEALGKHLRGTDCDFYSAGVETKLISDIPKPDTAISMGCDVGCPYIGKAFDDNWNLPDPTGHNDEAFIDVIRRIEENIMKL